MSDSDRPRPPFRSRREIHAAEHAKAREEFLKATGELPLAEADPEETLRRRVLADQEPPTSAETVRPTVSAPSTPSAPASRPRGRRFRPVDTTAQATVRRREDEDHRAAGAAAAAPGAAEGPAAAGEVSPLATIALVPSAPGEDGVSTETAGMRSRRLEQERRQSRRRRRNKRIRAFFVIVLVLALVGGAGYYALRALGGNETTVTTADDYPGPGSGEIQVVIEQGETGWDIGTKLVEADVVKSIEAFTRAWEANKASTSIRPGTYTLKLQMSATDAVAALLDEANRSDNTVTVNSGETLTQIVERMASVTDFSQEEITAALADADAIGLPAEAGGNAEGWLAPGTYEVGSDDTPATIFSQMIAQTVKTLDSLGVEAAKRQEVLIKASILEREVNIDEYLPMVARVIENRLADTDGETRGLLQMDSSVNYGVGKYGGVPTAADLADDNPYNTYLYPGLPPTPIAQPSVAAIEAVLAPAEGTWLYFVTIDLDTGETLFATTLAEQEANKAIFDKWCDDNPGRC